MKKIFINYSWQHHTDQASRLYQMLSSYNQFELWMDKQNLTGGLKWRPAIRKAIREADFFISLLSRESIVGRGERNKEIYEALDVLKEFPPDEIFLIPTFLNECRPPFEEMIDLDWIKLFPDWNEGFHDLLKALGVKVPMKTSIDNDLENKQSSKYHYRIGVVDLDLGLTNLPDIISKLNKIQSYFLFTLPEMPHLTSATETIAGLKNFAVYKIPESYIGEHRHLAVDLVACITKYPLAFKEDDRILYNYFAGPSDDDERFLFLSTDNLYQYSKIAGCSFEEAIVSILVGQLVGYFTKIGYHDETRSCVMDFCQIRSNIIFSLDSRSFCKKCSDRIPDGELKDSLFKLLSWRYGQV